jgi:hypothetical protein
MESEDYADKELTLQWLSVEIVPCLQKRIPPLYKMLYESFFPSSHPSQAVEENSRSIYLRDQRINRALSMDCRIFQHARHLRGPQKPMANVPASTISVINA